MQARETPRPQWCCHAVERPHNGRWSSAYEATHGVHCDVHRSQPWPAARRIAGASDISRVGQWARHPNPPAEREGEGILEAAGRCVPVVSWLSPTHRVSHCTGTTLSITIVGIGEPRKVSHAASATRGPLVRTWEGLQRLQAKH